MYLNILKKDLKRKKTMNVILAIFIVLSTMFMASSVNNIIAVTTGIDTFFEKADMADYYVLAIESGNENLKDEILAVDSVSDCRKEEIIAGSASDIKVDSGKISNLDLTALITSIGNAQLNYFAPDNEKITDIEKGKVYISGEIENEANLKVGDKLTLEIGDTSVELEYMGRAKDALFGSEFMGNPRILLSEEDYNTIYEDEFAQKSKAAVYYVETDDVSEVETMLGDKSGIFLNEGNDTIKLTYVMSMIVAALLLIVSIFLIAISLVVLKYTIGFTIAEEFREIGVMKAIGLKNSSIRSLYLVKYFIMAVVGAIVGFALSMPFSDMLLKSVSTEIYLESENSIYVAVFCSIAVVAITLLFCWDSTKKIKKLTAIDAVRNGQTGERFKKKSIMHLSKSKLGSTPFLATNDIISAPKKYSIITFVFTLLLLLVMILANTTNTLNSDKLLFLFGMTNSDAYINVSTAELMDAMGAGVDSTVVLEENNKKMEKTLKEHGMPADVHMEYLYNITVLTDDSTLGVTFQYCPDTKASDYTYIEGVAPESADEVALAYPIAEKLGKEIGDTITFSIDGEEVECTVTALYQTFMKSGKGCRLHEDFDVSKLGFVGAVAYQVDFEEEIDEAELERRMNELKDIYGEERVFDAAEFTKKMTGAADTINAVKNMVLLITILVVILVAVLMERSFISNEKSEIALMKAIGFSNKSIIWHHILRFAIVALVASMFAAILCMPLTKITMDPIMAIMGAVSGVGYNIHPVEIFVVYPVIIVAITIISAFFTSIYTNTIKSSDATNIE